MTESTAEHPAPAPSAPPPAPEKRCDDPTKPNTAYLVAASVAAKRSQLYTDDKEKIADRYKKLDGAQKQFQDKWNAQKTAWDNLKCQLERILKAVYNTVDEQHRKHLKRCWCDIVAETKEETKPVDCADVKKLSCEDLECKPKPAIGELRRLETLAEDCVKRYDQEFDDLAKLPDDIEGKITDLAAKATALEDAIAAQGSDPLRNYVAYLDLEWAFHKLWDKLHMSAAEYGCKLKNAFVDLLDAHRKSICLQVAVHEWTENKKYEDEEKEKKAGKIVDRVLEKCEPPQPTKPSGPEKPCKWEAECDEDEYSKPKGGYDDKTPKQDGGYDDKPPKQDGGYDDKPPKQNGGYDDRTPGQDPAGRASGAAC